MSMENPTPGNERSASEKIKNVGKRLMDLEVELKGRMESWEEEKAEALAFKRTIEKANEELLASTADPKNDAVELYLQVEENIREVSKKFKLLIEPLNGLRLSGTTGIDILRRDLELFQDVLTGEEKEMGAQLSMRIATVESMFSEDYVRASKEIELIMAKCDAALKNVAQMRGEYERDRKTGESESSS